MEPRTKYRVYVRFLLAIFSVGLAVLVAGCSENAPAAGPPMLGPGNTPATEAQVIAAVKTAETAKALSSRITPQQLIKSADDDRSLWALPDCDPEYKTTRVDDLTPCVLGAATGAHTMFVIGDSNAAMWARGLDLVGQRTGWRVILLAKNNCGPATMTYYQWQLKRDLTECDAWQQWRTDEVNRLKPEMVVLAGWYDGEHGISGPDRALTPDMWRDALATTVRKMPPGTKTVLLSNIPHITNPPAECLTKHSGDISACAESAKDIVPTYANDAIQQAAAATNASYVDVTRWFCDQTCPVVIADILAYSGKYHTTHDYARYLSGVLQDALRPAMA